MRWKSAACIDWRPSRWVDARDPICAEYKTMIEAQQNVLERTANPKLLPSIHDRGVMLYSQLVAGIALEEGTAAWPPAAAIEL